jgi:hypothetical protein
MIGVWKGRVSLVKAFRLLGIVAIVLSLLVATAMQADAYKGKSPEKEKATKVAPEERSKPEKTKTPKPKDTPEPVDTASEKVVICHKPGTPAQDTLSVPESALSGHLGHGDTLGPCVELAPPPEIVPTTAPTATVRITICHKPDTPAQKTLVLPESAIPGHLGHGDTLGPCLELAPPPEIVPTTAPTATVRITICHKPDTPAQKTLVLPESAIPGHLGHGDTLGPCLELAPLPEIVPTTAPTATVRITICHKPDTPAQKTLVLPESAIPGHLGHGDTLGPCDGSPPATSVARVVTAVLSLFFIFKEFLVLLPL